jgi:hypothetical protein
MQRKTGFLFHSTDVALTFFYMMLLYILKGLFDAVFLVRLNSEISES